MTDPTPGTPAPRSTRCWTLCGDRSEVDVEVSSGPGDRVADVLPEIARALGAPVGALWSGSNRLADDLSLADPQLLHGAVLGLDHPIPRDRTPRTSALELHVVGGPDAGRTVPLGRGRHILGRGGDASVRLDDPDVSRRHVAVHVGSGGIDVTDLGSTNGSRLGVTELDRSPREWPAGEV
ncbi:MAG: FHA domain-containing protein, partial [Saccharothrix sp.]|nr:FHA domain-containing protein [Saccharothrix sp.]